MMKTVWRHQKIPKSGYNVCQEVDERFVTKKGSTFYADIFDSRLWHCSGAIKKNRNRCFDATFRWGDTGGFIPEDKGSFYIDVEITREGTAEAKTVSIQVHSTAAKEGLDFSVEPKSLTFPAGDQVKRVKITIIDDGITEPTESFRLTLENGDGLTFNIQDNDGVFINEQSGFVSRDITFQCDITRSQVPEDQFDDYNAVKIYKQFNNIAEVSQASELAEISVTDPQASSNQSEHGSYTFRLTNLDLLAAELENIMTGNFLRHQKRLLNEDLGVPKYDEDTKPAYMNINWQLLALVTRLLTDVIWRSLTLINVALFMCPFFDLKLTDSGYFWCVFSRPSNPESFFALQQMLLRVNPCVPPTDVIRASDNTCIDLADLTMVEVENDNVMEVATTLAEATDRPDGIFTDKDVVLVGNVIENIVAVGDGSAEVTGAVAESISNLIGATDSKVPPTFQFTNNTTSRITQSLETQVSLSLQQNGEVRVVESNLAIQGVKYDPPDTEDDITGIGFAILTNSDVKFENNTTETFYDDDIIEDKHPPSSIFLSSDIVESLKKKKPGNDLKFLFLAYRTDFLFASKKALENDLKVEGVILTASVDGVDMKDLAELVEPVEIENQKEPESAALLSRDSCHFPGPQCVFWDHKLNDWSSEGCRYVGLDDDKRDRRKCECDHLTNFAVLVYHGKNRIESQALDIISKIGCGLSLATLTLTVSLFTFFKKLRRKGRTITVYLCISLIGLYLVFVIAMDWTCPRIPCSIAAALLHYFVLTTMAWMAVEARYLYIKLVRIFDPENAGFVNRAAGLAWGCPVIIVAISLGASFKSFQNEHYCFPTVGWVVYFAVLLPIALVLIHNIVSFALIMRTIFRGPRPGQKSRSDREKKILIERFRHSFTITFLLGLTWVFGFFAIDTATIVFQYLFCILNSLQGVFIFVFTCLLQDEVKNVLFSSCRSGRRSSTSTGETRSGTGGRSSGSRSGGTNFQSTSDNSEFRSAVPDNSYSYPSTGTASTGAYDSGYDNRGIELSTQAR